MIVEDVSSNELQNNTSKTNLKGALPTPTSQQFFQPIDELELLINQTDEAEDRKEITLILGQILNYPSTELASLHRQCMQLGGQDLILKGLQDDMKPSKSNDKESIKTNSKICQCCGFTKQESGITLCTPFDNVKNLGTATYLYFSTFKNLGILMGILTLIYSIYSLITNIIANKNNNGAYSVDYLSISLAPKQKVDSRNNRQYYLIQCILGAVTMFIWILVFVSMKYYEIKSEEEEDDQTISCSDYSVVLEGVPVDIKENELQKQFDDYFNAVTEHQKIPLKRRKPFKIVKLSIGKPYYLSEDALQNDDLKQMEKKISEMREMFVKWIKERQNNSQFSESKQVRQAKYAQYHKLLASRQETYLEMEKKIKKQLQEQSNDRLTTAFVSFQTNYAQQLMSFLNNLTIFRRIQGICGDVNRFVFFRGDEGYHLDIRRAPQPEDIVWTNIGLRDCSIYGRKIFTFSATAVLLGVCFVIVYALSAQQKTIQSNVNTSGSSRYLSIVISIVISVVNIVLGQVIKFLTLFQRDYTETNHQASLAIKSIVAQMINSILIPVIVAYYINNNIYDTSGLADNIFMLCITNSLVPPVLILFDPYNLFVKLLACIKSRSSSKLYQTQKQHNTIHQKIEFEVGYQYLYVVNLFMFVCFFVSLQPIAPFFALIGYLCMYWAQKYCLFNRYKRPIPGTDFIHKAVYQIVYLGPLTYTLGSLTWSNLSPTGIPPEALYPNLVAIGFSILILIVPFPTIITGCLKDDTDDQLTNYIDQRDIFPSEYDRLNPTTRKEAIVEFQKFRESQKANFNKLSKEQQQKKLKLINANAQRAQLNQVNPQKLMGSVFNPNPVPFMQHQPMPYYANPMSSGFGSHPMNPMAMGGYNPQASMMPQVPYGAPQMGTGMGMNMGMNNMNMGYNPYNQMGGYQNAYNPYNNYGMYGGYRPS